MEPKGLTFSDEIVFNQFSKTQSGRNAIEIRCLGVYGKSILWGNQYAKGTVNGYFDSFKKFLPIYNELVLLQKEMVFNIFFTLNEIDERLLARSYNRMSISRLTTSDNDITNINYIPIDIDPIRPAGISSSKKELEKAWDVVNNVYCYHYDVYCNKFHAEREMITARSGNGYHVLIPFIKKNLVKWEKEYTVKKIINSISEQCSTSDVEIDLAVFNPSRIMKLYGTLAMKGDEVPHQERFYRGSYIL